ncbi:YdcF family protein [Patescibacteria group bacterium]|nr:YdcF family protein [Patescibacteria group bacterium]
MKKVLALIVVCALVAFTYSIVPKINKKSVQDQIYTSVEDVPAKPTAVIFGEKVYVDDRMSDVLQDRVDTAIELYKTGKIDRIFVTGQLEETYDEVTVVKDTLVLKGIPERIIILDYSGFGTYDSLFRAKYVYGYESMILISQDFHLPRALYIANRLEIDAVGLKTTGGNYFYSQSYTINENIRLFKSMLDVLTKKQPASMEKKMTIL